MRPLRAAVLLLAALALAGCATRPVQPEVAIDWDQRAAWLVADAPRATPVDLTAGRFATFFFAISFFLAGGFVYNPVSNFPPPPKRIR